ncbi:MAG: restriction endonuclease subunit S [Planctomycetaceae bacterium]
MNLDAPAWRVIPDNDVERRKLRTGDLIVTKSSGSPDHIGKCAVFIHPEDGHDYYFSNFMLRLRADDSILDHRWLFYWLTSDRGRFELQRLNSTTTGLRNVNVGQYLGQTIPLPPLSEQKRIADILDKADAILRKRQEAGNALDDLLNSQFWKLFHAEMAIPANETTHVLIDTVDFLDYRGKSPPKSDSGIPLVTAKHVKRGWFEFDPPEFVPKDRYDGWMQRGLPRPGDVLFTTEGHTMGSAALLPRFEKVALAQRLIALQCKDTICPDFLLHFVLSDRFQNEVRKRATGSAAQGIRAKELQNIPIPLPAMEKQILFGKIASAIQIQKERSAQSISDADGLFNSLVQCAFKGEL